MQQSFGLEKQRLGGRQFHSKQVVDAWVLTMWQSF